jgi:hypothetical protein
MTENLPQPFSESIVPNILALNNAYSVELLWLDVDRLKSLLRRAFYARMIGSADAFLFAFEQGASYDSPNYMWFRQRYTRFVSTGLSYRHRDAGTWLRPTTRSSRSTPPWNRIILSVGESPIASRSRLVRVPLRKPGGKVVALRILVGVCTL